MKVCFNGFNVTEKVIEQFDSRFITNRDYHFVKGDVYLVIAMHINTSGGITFHCLDMYGHISYAPANFFSISDDRVSKYWQLRIRDNGDATFFPKEYYEEEYFHDDLSEDVPEIVAKFQNLIGRLKQEYS